MCLVIQLISVIPIKKLLVGLGIQSVKGPTSTIAKKLPLGHPV